MTNRCYYLDLAKILATFLVILGHLYSSDSTVRLYIYAFHMPLFFMISGVFHKYKGKVNWTHYCKTLLWPIAVFIFLDILISTIIWGGFSRLLDTFFIQLPLGKYDGILWFLFALLWCKILTDTALYFHRPVLMVLLWGIIFFVPVLLNARLPFELTQGLMAFPFYFAGFLFKDKFLAIKPSFQWVVPLVVCFVLSVLITRLHGRVSMVSVHFGQLAKIWSIDFKTPLISLSFLGADIFLFYLNGFIGSFMILSLALLPFPDIPVVTTISKSLITVVGTQYLFITPIIKYWGLDQPLWMSIFLSFGILALCSLLHLVLRPVYNWVR